MSVDAALSYAEQVHATRPNSELVLSHIARKFPLGGGFLVEVYRPGKDRLVVPAFAVWAAMAMSTGETFVFASESEDVVRAASLHAKDPRIDVLPVHVSGVAALRAVHGPIHLLWLSGVGEPGESARLLETAAPRVAVGGVVVAPAGELDAAALSRSGSWCPFLLEPGLGQYAVERVW